MSTKLKLGMIGLDTSHVVAFTKLLNQPDQEYHVPGGEVAIAFPGGSEDFELSYSRVEGFTHELSHDFGVRIADTLEQVAEAADAILLESVDGRVHLEQLKRIVEYGKPVFIDKPLAVSSADAMEIKRLADHWKVPVMSASALRYAEGLTAARRDEQLGGIIGADSFGPMNIVPTQPGFFWYGIHSVEMLFAVLGRECRQVRTVTVEDHDVIIGEWSDGSIGTVRGNRKGNNQFGATIYREQGSHFVDVGAFAKPYYASLLEQVMSFFQTGEPSVSLDETVQVIRFIEAANESRGTGRPVTLHP